MTEQSPAEQSAPESQADPVEPSPATSVEDDDDFDLDDEDED